MLRITCHALITIAAVLVSGAVAAQVGTPPPQPTINGWAYSTIESNIQVTGISQVLTGSSDLTGQTQETQHVAYSHDQGLVRYATRSNSNGGAWTSNWTLHPWGLICADPSLAVDNTGRPFIHCIGGNTVQVAWRNPDGLVVAGYVDFNAEEARAGTVALRMNTDGSLRAVHVVYQKRGPTGSRVVAHRYCTTFPVCVQPSDWRGVDNPVPVSDVRASKVALVSSTSDTVEVAFLRTGIDQPTVAFVKWHAQYGWSNVVFPSGYVNGVRAVVFKRNINGKIAAVSTESSTGSWAHLYVIEWNEQGYPYRYQKFSGDDLVDPDNHFDVLLTSPGSVTVVYQRDDTDDLMLARRGTVFAPREVVASQGNTGRFPRVDRAIDGKLLITFWDATDAKLRSIYR